MDIDALKKWTVEKRSIMGIGDKMFGNETPTELLLGLYAEMGELTGKIIKEYNYGNNRGDIKDKDSLDSEFADVMIFALALANACNIDIEKQIFHKMELNMKRYGEGGTHR